MFERVARRLDPVPGAPAGTVFDSIGGPVLEHGTVAFVASGSGGWLGAYSWNAGVLDVIVDLSTQVPGFPSGTTLEVIEQVATDGVAFAVSSNGSTGQGLYTTLGGQLRTVADGLTELPNGLPGEVFVGIGRPTMGPGSVWFFAAGNQGSWGLYKDEGSGLQVVIDGTVEIPGRPGVFFTNPGGLSTDGTWATFCFQGVYQATSPTNVIRVADLSTPMPGAAPGESWDRFCQNFYPTSTSDGHLIFGAEGDQVTQGIYGTLSGELDVIVDTRGGVLHSVTQGSVDGDRVVFRDIRLEDGNWVSGAWLKEPGREPYPIVEAGDDIGDHVVFSVGLAEPAISGDEVAFWTPSAVYVARLPSENPLEIPSASPAALTVLVLTLGAMALALLRRRRNWLS